LELRLNYEVSIRRRWLGTNIALPR